MLYRNSLSIQNSDKGEQKWMVTERVKKENWKGRREDTLGKPMVQIPVLSHTFFPKAFTSSLLKSSEDIWSIEELSTDPQAVSVC